MNLTCKKEFQVSQIKSVANDELIRRLKDFVAQEKAATLAILHLLQEVERRKLELSRGHASLYKFCIHELGYSEAEALIRIRAMRLLKVVPEAEAAIQNGDLSLSNAAEVQSQIRRENERRKKFSLEALSPETQRSVLSQVQKSTSRECQRSLALVFPEIQAVAAEKVKVLRDERTLIQFSADAELMAKLDKLKGLVAHKNYSVSFEELFAVLADIALKKLDPMSKGKKTASRRENEHENKHETKEQTKEKSKDKNTGGEPISLRIEPQETELDAVEPRTHTVPKISQENSSLAVHRSRYIPASLRRKVWMKAKGQCEYLSSQTGLRCSSSHALEVDHIQLFSKGGETKEGNLRLLCDVHNRARNLID